MVNIAIEVYGKDQAVKVVNKLISLGYNRNGYYGIITGEAIYFTVNGDIKCMSPRDYHKAFQNSIDVIYPSTILTYEQFINSNKIYETW